MKPINTLFLTFTLFISSNILSHAQINAITLIDGERLYGAEYSNDGSKLVLGSLYNVEIRESTTGKLIIKMNRTSGIIDEIPYPFGSFAFSPDNTLLLGGHNLGMAVLWDVETGKVIHYFYPPNSAPSGTPAWSTSAVAFSANGKEMATLKGGALTFWDVETGTLLREGEGTYYNAGEKAFGEMYLYPDGKRVFTRLFSHSQITNYITGERVADFGKTDASLSHDGRNVFLIDFPNQTYQTIDVESKAVLRDFSSNLIGYRLTVAPDNQTVAYSRENIIYIECWPLIGDRKELDQIPIVPTINEFEYPHLRFSPNGKQLMVRQYKSLKLYDVSNLTSGVSEVETPKQ